MKAVIIAAGIGSRLWRETFNIPKTLLPFGEGTILSTIMTNFAQIGIGDFVIVAGYQSWHIKNYLKKNNNLGYDVTLIENIEWAKGNGISVLVAETETGNDNFLLSMSDHVVSVNALEKIANSRSKNNLLLVDPQIDAIFDIEDATKVALENTKITDIGKDITRYNGIDCGIFRLNPHFYKAMRKALKKDRDSISAAVKALIENGDMEAVFLEPDDKWIDIDTPQAYQFCLDKIKF